MDDKGSGGFVSHENHEHSGVPFTPSPANQSHGEAVSGSPGHGNADGNPEDQKEHR